MSNLDYSPHTGCLLHEQGGTYQPIEGSRPEGDEKISTSDLQTTEMVVLTRQIVRKSYGSRSNGPIIPRQAGCASTYQRQRAISTAGILTIHFANEPGLRAVLPSLRSYSYCGSYPTQWDGASDRLPAEQVCRDRRTLVRVLGKTSINSRTTSRPTCLRS